MRISQAIAGALNRGKRIWIRSHTLRDGGEIALEQAVLQTLAHYGRGELAGAVHAAVRELVQNASKAALKRVVFEDLGLDPYDPTDYERGIAVFRKYLVESQMARYRRLFARKGLTFEIHICHEPRRAVFSVINRAVLLEHEERRIREKFVLAGELDNLFDFYIKFGDNTEGAGMGIAMVEILLQEAGIERHNFTIFSQPQQGTTTARIVVPLAGDYVSPRERFRRELARSGLTPEQLRQRVRSGEFVLEAECPPSSGSPRGETHPDRSVQEARVRTDSVE